MKPHTDGTFRGGLIALLLIFSLNSVFAQENASKTEQADTFAIPEAEKPFWESAQSFLDSYAAKDAEAIGQLFTEEAEFLDEEGVKTEGRAAIVERYQSVFEEAPNVVIESINIENVRFIGNDVAVEAGIVVSALSDTHPRVTSRYAAIHRKGADGEWKIEILKDFPATEPTRQQHLAQLEWMVGDWVNEDRESVVKTTCDWSEDGNYLLRRFSVEFPNGLQLSGVQRTGWDPILKKLRSWTFDSEGGFMTGTWTRTDDGWLLTSNGVSSDGQPVTSTAVYRMVDSEMIEWNYSNLIIGNESLGAGLTIRMVRRPPSPATETTGE